MRANGTLGAGKTLQGQRERGYRGPHRGGLLSPVANIPVQGMSGGA